MARVCLGDTKGIKVLKSHKNDFIGVRVDLTRKMTREGVIKYAVVVYNMDTNRPYRIKMCRGIAKAFGVYKEAIA